MFKKFKKPIGRTETNSSFFYKYNMNKVALKQADVSNRTDTFTNARIWSAWPHWLNKISNF